MAIAVIAPGTAETFDGDEGCEFLKAAAGFIASSTPGQLARPDVVEV
jgi:hypothetical protein